MKLKDGKSYNYLADAKYCTPYREALRDATICQLHQMFHVKQLPDTIPEYVFMRNALSGWQWIRELDGKYISFCGGPDGCAQLGAGYDYNYLPTHITIANPYLEAGGKIPDYKTPATKTGGYSGVYPVTDGVLIKSNSELMPLYPLIDYFAALEDVAATTLRMGLVVSRMALNWLAKNDNDKAAMEAYIKQIEAGKLAVAHTDAWTEEDAPTLAVGANAGSATLLKSQIEALQYVRGYKWQTFGVQSNHNMKREAINESEAGMNENSLLPLIDDIYANLKAGIDELNERYGLNVTIEYASAWEEVQEETDPPEGGETDVLPGETPDSGGERTGADTPNNDNRGESD